MSKLTEGIGEDIGMALKKITNNNLKIEEIKREHEKSIRELQSNLTTQKKRVDTLQARNLELENALENGRFPVRYPFQELSVTSTTASTLILSFPFFLYHFPSYSSLLMGIALLPELPLLIKF